MCPVHMHVMFCLFNVEWVPPMPCLLGSNTIWADQNEHRLKLVECKHRDSQLLLATGFGFLSKESKEISGWWFQPIPFKTCWLAQAHVKPCSRHDKTSNCLSFRNPAQSSPLTTAAVLPRDTLSCEATEGGEHRARNVVEVFCEAQFFLPDWWRSARDFKLR